MGAPIEDDLEIGLAEDAAAEPPGGEGEDEDLEAARLVALNMALDGASRDEVERELRDKHQVADPGPLIAEVYTSIGR